MNRQEETSAALYFGILVLICGVILFALFVRSYSKEVDRAVEEYADSCVCRTHTWENGVTVEDCLCPTGGER